MGERESRIQLLFDARLHPFRLREMRPEGQRQIVQTGAHTPRLPPPAASFGDTHEHCSLRSPPTFSPLRSLPNKASSEPGSGAPPPSLPRFALYGHARAAAAGRSACSRAPPCCRGWALQRGLALGGTRWGKKGKIRKKGGGGKAWRCPELPSLLQSHAEAEVGLLISVSSVVCGCKLNSFVAGYE